MIKVFLDACIIIYIVEKHPIYAVKIESLMNAAGNHTFCFSPLIRLECLVMPLRTKDVQLQKLYEMFFDAQSLLYQLTFMIKPHNSASIFQV